MASSLANEVRRTRFPVGTPVLAGAVFLIMLYLVSYAESPAANLTSKTIDTMYLSYRSKFPDVKEISAVELAGQQPSDVLVVDVRDAKERAVSYLPGSVTQEDFENDSKLSEGKVVVLFCTIGYRSGVYAQKLQQQGRDVRNLKGGILAWCHAGQRVVDRNGPTDRVHVYGRKWNLLPQGYEAVW